MSVKNSVNTPTTFTTPVKEMDSMVEKKLEKLQEAFIKCLEVSIGSIKESDCQDCFGDQRKPLGMQLQRTYINLLAEVERRLETEELPRINQEFQIPQIIESLNHQNNNHNNNHNNTLDPSSSSLPPIEDPMKQLRPVIKAMKRAEIDELTNGAKFLETEIKKSRDIAGRLRTQMLNEIEALNEENMKILHASNQAL